MRSREKQMVLGLSSKLLDRLTSVLDISFQGVDVGIIHACVVNFGDGKQNSKQ